MKNKMSWEEAFSLVEEYYKEHGNIDIPRYYVVDGKKLGIWIRDQRFAYHKKQNLKITQEQIKKLDSIGMKWDINSVKWQEKFNLLKEYYLLYGTSNITKEVEISNIK